MAFNGSFSQSDEYRREELIRVIEHSVEQLTLQELEALYYDMSKKTSLNDSAYCFIIVFAFHYLAAAPRR